MKIDPSAALPWLFISNLCGVISAKPKSKDDEAQKVLLSRHSFSAPLEYHGLLDDWTVSGASLFERERLLMHPGVAERHGFLWSKAPLLTNDFEVTFQFRVAGEQSPTKLLQDQSFGFYYVMENISKGFNETAVIKAESWTKGMKDHGLTLGGSKAIFEGFGAVLSVADKQGKPRPAVSGFSNDGHTTMSWGTDLPLPEAKQIDFRNTLNAAQMRIRVKPTAVQGWLKLSPSLSWNECFSLDRSKIPIKKGGYMGLAAWSGTAAAGVSADLVSVAQLEVRNFDETSIGEEMKDVSAQIQETYMQMLTDENRHFLDQKSQTDHLARLVDLLSEHLKTSKPADEQLFDTLKNYEQRVERLNTDCKNIVQGAHLFMGTSGEEHAKAHKTGVQVMKNEILGMRRILVKDHASHRQKLDEVSKKVGEVKDKAGKDNSPVLLNQIVKQTDNLEKTVRSRGSQMSWMMFCLLAAIVGIGVLMWNRMHYYEKKHFI